MPIDASIYGNLKTMDMPTAGDAQAKAMSLKALSAQQQKGEREEKYASHLQKASVYGNALEGMAGMSPEERAANYPKVRQQLIQDGVLGEADAPPSYDDRFYQQHLMKFRQTKEGLEKQKTMAEIENLKRKGTGADDPLARQMAMLDYREQMAKRKQDEEMRRYSQVGGWKLAEGATPTADDAKKFKSGISAAKSLLGNLNEYQNLVKEYGSEAGGKVAQRMDSLVRDIQLTAKNEDLYSLGVLTGPDLGLLDEIIGTAPTGVGSKLNPTAWFGSKADNKSQQFRDMINRRIDAKASTYGFEANPEWRELAAGGAKPTEEKGGSPLGGNKVMAAERQTDDGSRVWKDLGITAKKAASMGTGDLDAIKWARKNPNDPRAKTLLELNGVE